MRWLMTQSDNYESLKRHDVSVDEIDEVLRSMVTVAVEIGPSRVGNDRVMLVGPTLNLRLLEIGIEYLPNDIEYVFHANDATKLMMQAFIERRRL
jgi:uncharacterized DUF497 family protein